MRFSLLKSLLPPLACCILIAVALSLTGCRSGPKGDAAQPPEPAPTFDELAAVHEARRERLSSLYGIGVIEIRWRDERDRRQFEQGNMELWVQQPTNLALRVYKAGRDFLWVGSDDTHFWVFDMTGDDTILVGGPHGEFGVQMAEIATALDPLLLLDLCGFGPMQQPIGDVEWNADHRAWAATALGRAGLVRMFFTPESFDLIRVEHLNIDGEPVISSAFGSTILNVARAGKPPGEYGRIYRRIEIRHEVEDARVTLFFDSSYPPTDGVIDEMLTPRVFDLERLMRRMPPERIEGDLSGRVEEARDH